MLPAASLSHPCKKRKVGRPPSDSASENQRWAPAWRNSRARWRGTSNMMNAKTDCLMQGSGMTMERTIGSSSWLWWVIPIVYGAAVELSFFIAIFGPMPPPHQKLLLAFLVPACVVAPIGGWWALYQCVRHEQRPLKYIAIIVLVPFGFAWYYFERYRLREQGASRE